MKKLVLETTAPFQGLPELVADQEGLFAKEGLQIEWVERESDDKSTQVNVNTPKGLNPFSIVHVGLAAAGHGPACSAATRRF